MKPIEAFMLEGIMDEYEEGYYAGSNVLKLPFDFNEQLSRIEYPDCLSGLDKLHELQEWIQDDFIHFEFQEFAAIDYPTKADSNCSVMKNQKEKEKENEKQKSKMEMGKKINVSKQIFVYKY